MTILGENGASAKMQFSLTHTMKYINTVGPT